jgi:hypothetical protein
MEIEGKACRHGLNKQFGLQWPRNAENLEELKDAAGHKSGLDVRIAAPHSDVAHWAPEFALAAYQHCGEEGGAFGHGFRDDMFAGGMRAVAHGAEAVQRGCAKRGSEVAVGAAAGGTFADLQAHLFG